MSFGKIAALPKPAGFPEPRAARACRRGREINGPRKPLAFGKNPDRNRSTCSQDRENPDSGDFSGVIEKPYTFSAAVSMTGSIEIEYLLKHETPGTEVPAAGQDERGRGEGRGANFAWALEQVGFQG
ncbi:hypothetical protein KM043_008423 [Ampulex compressa]|nr:hypothetical protein KM043_008423 [Ampulex compressa]